jgi:hypothetical protein
MLNRFLSISLVGASLIASLAGQEARRPGDDAFQLGLILKSAREYCRRLERAALDFVCLEEISESVNLGRDGRGGAPATVAPEGSANSGTGSQGGHTSTSRPGRALRFNTGPGAKFNNTYVNDYQFIRRDGKVEEKRVLIEKNGKKANAKTPRPAMMAFNFADILLGPVQLLDERNQEFYAYRLAGKDTVDGHDCWILEVTPRFTGVTRYLGGKIWLGADDSSVVRIEWDPTTFGRYEDILAVAERYKSTPEVRSYSEFGVEKNGLRFPSEDLTEEAYRGADGQLFVRSKTSIVYRGHKFFTVETQTIFK